VRTEHGFIDFAESHATPAFPGAIEQDGQQRVAIVFEVGRFIHADGAGDLFHVVVAHTHRNRANAFSRPHGPGAIEFRVARTAHWKSIFVRKGKGIEMLYSDCTMAMRKPRSSVTVKGLKLPR